MDHAKNVDALAVDSEDRSIDSVDQMAVRDAQLSRLRNDGGPQGKPLERGDLALDGGDELECGCGVVLRDIGVNCIRSASACRVISTRYFAGMLE